MSPSYKLPGALRAGILSLGALMVVAGPVGRAADSAALPLVGEAAVTVPRAKQHDFTSKINGRTYRIFVSTPFNAEPNKRYPAFYVLDGNWYFAPASVNATECAREIGGAIVVGVGYPTDDHDVIRERRVFELTPASVASSTPGQYGGGDAFLRVLEEEIRPFVNARYAVDPARQILYGKSLGGLMVLRQLFTKPEAYSTYIAASAAIWIGDRVILKDEAAFAARVKAGSVQLRVLLTAAGNEQYRGPDPALREKDPGRYIDNAMELADRLASLDPVKLQVEKVIFPDESHVSVSLSAIGRALYFGIKP